MRPRPPPSLPTGFRWVVQLFVIIFFTGLLWYSVAGANHILATWGIWIPCFACFLVFPSAILRPPGAYSHTDAALTMRPPIPTSGMDDSGRLLISAVPDPATGRLTIRSWNLSCICDGDPLDDDVIHDHPPFGCDWTILRVFPETHHRFHGRTSRDPFVHASVGVDVHALRKTAS